MGRLCSCVRTLFERIVLWSSDPVKQKPEENSQPESYSTLDFLLSPGESYARTSTDPRQGIDLGIA